MSESHESDSATQRVGSAFKREPQFEMISQKKLKCGCIQEEINNTINKYDTYL
jgi:hypothetical protein